jgi:hypothetical protein
MNIPINSNLKLLKLKKKKNKLLKIDKKEVGMRD